MTSEEQKTCQEMAASPERSAKEGWKNAGCELRIGGDILKPGGWLYGDADGLLYSEIECR